MSELGWNKGSTGRKDTFVHSVFCFCLCFAKCASVMSYDPFLELTGVFLQSFLRFYTHENPGLEPKDFLKNI